MDEAEAHRRYVADQLARLVEGASDRSVMLLDERGTIVSWNAGAVAMFGWSKADAIGRHLSDLYPAQHRPRTRVEMDLALVRERNMLRTEDWRYRRDGSEFFADVMIVALRNDAGVLTGYGKSVADVTSRRAAEHAREQSDGHIRSILATVPDAMVVIDEAGVIVSFSAAAERLFGYREHEAVGRNVSMLMPRSDRERHDDYIRRYKDSGEARIIGIGRIVTGRRSDGSSFPMELSIGEANAGGSKIFTAFIRDLTAQHLAEVRLKELQAELVHVSRVSAMGTMASTLAHELNQPLAAITNYLEAGRDLIGGSAIDSPDLLREAMDEAARSALHAGEIVRRLRDFVARGESERSVQHLPTLIDEAARLGLLGTSEHSVRFFADLDPRASHVVADRIQIEQVVVNLLRNAAEAIAASDQRDITLSTRRVDDVVHISVSDTGPGIDEGMLPRLFEAFATARTGGLGLGLSICRTIVEAHGGRIWAHAGAGVGTEFHFTLPADVGARE